MDESKDLPQESGSSDAKDTNEVPQSRILGNDLGVRTRADIYERFDKASQVTDSSSETEESNTEEDLKKASGQRDSSPEIEEDKEDSEKPTSVKKGKEADSDSGGQKLVPLQALHESRDRFRKLNLEYRDYKTEQDKAMQDLKTQVEKLQQALKSGSTSTEDDFAGEDEKVHALRRELAEIRKKYEGDETNKAQEAAIKAQQEQQKKIGKVTQDLTDEGYPGFDIAVLKTGAKLQEMVNAGDITETESVDPEVWKKVYKENIFPDVKQVFSEREKAEIMDRKKAAKKNANLVADPGKAPEKPTKEDKKNPTYEEFVKESLDERVGDFRSKFYKRR